MSDDRIKGDWAEAKGWVKEQWGKLTDDDLTVIDGKLDQLVGRIRQRYGWETERAEREVHEWNRRNVVGR